MSLDQALAELDECASTQDPIIYKGEETSPEQLLYLLDQTLLAGKVRFSYWGMKSNCTQLIRNGTLAGMVKDRYLLLDKS